MATGPAGNQIDSRSIQEVVVVDSQGNFTALATASGTGSSSVTGTVNIAGNINASGSQAGAGVVNVQGTTVASFNGTAINPVLIGGLDLNSPQLIQPAQVDSFLDLQVSLGTRLDPYNDNVNAINSLGYPTQQRFAAASTGTTTIAIPLAPAVSTASGAPTPLANSLGAAGLPSLMPVKWGRFSISNDNTGQAITGFNVAFSDTVDGTTDTVTYTYPLTISQANNAVARYFMPFPDHYSIYPNATLTLTLGAAASRGYGQVQTVWGFTPPTSYPSEYQWTFAANITGSTGVSLMTPSVANTRLAIEELVVTNGSTVVATDFSFISGSAGGTTIFQSYGYLNGMGFKYGPYDFPSAQRMAVGAQLFGKATASGGNFFVTGRGHYEPN